MHEFGNVVVIRVICEIRNYAWKLTFYEQIFGFHRLYQMSGRLSLNIIVHVWLHWNEMVIRVHWIVIFMWCALSECESLYHPWPSSVEGLGKARPPKVQNGPPKRDDPTRPGTLCPRHPTSRSGRAVAIAAIWVDGRAAPLWRRRLDRCWVVWGREGHLLCGA